MSDNRAIFKFNDGNVELLCSECGAVVKTDPKFDIVVKFAAKGIVTLEPQYCDKHKYLGMYGHEKEVEMTKQGIKEQLREGIMDSDNIEE